MGQPRPLFCLFSVFSNKQYNFTTNICEKCPSSIRCRDSNPRPLERESLPFTTRPGLPPNIVHFLFHSFKSISLKGCYHLLNYFSVCLIFNYRCLCESGCKVVTTTSITTVSTLKRLKIRQTSVRFLLLQLKNQGQPVSNMFQTGRELNFFSFGSWDQYCKTFFEITSE